MKTRTALMMAVGSLFAVAGVASAADYDDYARVLSVSPQSEQVNQPTQECHTEVVETRGGGERGAGGAIIGGVAGGIIGNQVGGGNGRAAATAIGAITGAIVGDRIENDRPQTVREQQVQRCRTVDRWVTRNNGYAVTYEYHGRNYTSIMPYDPGERMRVHVSVTPRP